MKLTVLGSNSNGNCYLLQAERQTLIIEAGIKARYVKQALDFNLSQVVGVVITHCHSDHAGYARELQQAGINIYAHRSVFEAKHLTNQPFCHEITPHIKFRIGEFAVFPFEVMHDVPCMGFVIDHAEMGRLLFVTDTMLLEYVVPRLNHILLEANYSDFILEQNIQSGRVPAAMRERLLQSHIELQTTKSILAANDLSQVREIVLIHLSDNNSDERLFAQEIEAQTGIPTYAAKTGLTINLTNNQPY